MRRTPRRAAAASALLLPLLVTGVHADAALRPGWLPAAVRTALDFGAGSLAVTVTPTVVPATGGTALVTGADFGASVGDFTKAKWSATADGKPAKVTWVSASSMKVAIPTGTAGSFPSIVIAQGDAKTDPDTTSVVRGGAYISTVTASLDGVNPKLKLTGAGFAGSDQWQLTPEADGGSPVSLPVVTDPTSVGVVLGSGGTAATVRLPAAPGPAGGWRLSFTPSGDTQFAPTDGARYVYKLPTLTGVSATVLSTDGGTFTIKGTGLGAVDPNDASAVTLTSATDPDTTVGLTVTPKSDTAADVTVPAAAAGDYTLAVNTPLGAAVAKSKITVSLVAPLAVTVPDGTALPATGGTLVLNGTGFGATKKDFTSAKIGATIGSKKATVAWVSDTRLAVTVPPGDPGTQATIVLTRRDVPSAPLQVPYMAVITKLSVSTGPASGGTVVTVTGRGFKNGSTWVLSDDSGNAVAQLPAVTTLDGATSGVLVTDDTKATVKMPASDKPFRLVYLSVTPDQTAYASSGYLPTSKAVFVYSDAG